MLINKNIESSHRIKNKKSVKRYGFFTFSRNLSNKYVKKLLDTAITALKTTFKKVIHKAAEVSGDFMTNKIDDKILKPKNLKK